MSAMKIRSRGRYINSDIHAKRAFEKARFRLWGGSFAIFFCSEPGSVTPNVPSRIFKGT
jgi:hypothetical protein